jgi:uridine kinase
MKVALLIAGHLRTLNDNLKILRENIIKKFDQIDIYIYITENDWESDSYFNPNDNDNLSKIITELSPKPLLIEKLSQLSSDQRENSLKNQWYKFYKLCILLENCEISENFEYDLIIKTRPDLVLSSDNIFDNVFDTDKIQIPEESLIDSSKLDKPFDPSICDSFAFGPAYLMKHYLVLYKHLNLLSSQYGFVSETLLYHYLNSQNIPFETRDISYSIVLSRCNVIAIAGDSGSGKSVLAEVLRNFFSKSFILEGDRYHKWERNDPNWLRMTHLNPEANYLTKLKKDIFDLKIGKKIYQVNYDHKLGKFTEPEVIDPEENIIVCGLHSLLGDYSDIYDLRIYLEPDESLRQEWKVSRDVNERGKNPEYVKNEIKRRESDFQHHVSPQRNNSDLLISFKAKSTNGEIYLQLAICRGRNWSKVVSDFRVLNINFEMTHETGWVWLNFASPLPNINFKNKLNIELPDYYDYIIYAIISLGQS